MDFLSNLLNCSLDYKDLKVQVTYLTNLIKILDEKEKKIMIDLTALTAKVDAVAAVIPGIAADYAELKAEIAALTGQIDPTLQAKLDALTAKLGTSVAALVVLDNSVVPPVVPPTP
jgi:chromosome segregation ATPase